MAKYAKISLLSQPALWHVSYSDDLEALVQNMMRYLRQNIECVLPDQPDLIVVPEVCDRYPSFTIEQRKAYYRYRGDRIRDMYCEIAREHHCYIAYSACRYLPDEEKLPFHNSTQLIGRDGEIVGIYDKNHLVPAELEEGEIAYGTEAPVFETDFGRVCFAICFDLNYMELRDRYFAKKPQLIIFSSMYHGGITQFEWAYQLRAYFAGAICGGQSRIINPFGETVATTTNYYNYVTGRVNMDFTLVHLDRNWDKLRAAKKKYGDQLIQHDPGCVGAVMLSYEGTDRTVMDIVREFDIMLLDDYFTLCRQHRRDHVE